VSFGLTVEKLLIILVIAAFLIGPNRLPELAAQLARLTRRVRDFATGAKERVREEMGDEFDEVDWSQLDPRRYDPRRIIADALLESPKPPAQPVVADRRLRRAAQAEDASSAPGEAPFDTEAT